MKKYMAAGIVFIGIFVMVLFVGSGFSRRTDVVLTGFSISEDGSVMTLEAGPAGSMGYIRDMTAKRSGSAVYCSFYTAFGGPNSRIGAEDQFELEVDDSCTEIYFDRGEGEAALVLQKDKVTDGWVQKTGKEI